MQEWKDTQKQEFDFLDSKDLLPFILSEPNADNLMDTLEEKFELEYLSSCKIPDEGLFNWITTDEFLDYIIGVASGEETKNEKNGYREISIFKDGIVL